MTAQQTVTCPLPGTTDAVCGCGSTFGEEAIICEAEATADLVRCTCHFVPEPASVPSLGAGLVLLALLARRRRR